MKIGVTLSGGAVKGVAHLGVLRALRDIGVEPYVYMGTSAGAIVSVLKSEDVLDEDILQLARTSKLTQLVKFNWPKLGLLPMDKLRDRMKNMVLKEDLADLNRRVWINVTDIESGRGVYVSKGPVLDYVMASCAIPMMFQPQKIGNRFYIDGGITNNMPAKFLRGHCDFVIGSNVVSLSATSYSNLKGFLPILDRSLHISLQSRTEMNHGYCDFVFNIPSMDRYDTFAFDKVDQIYNYAYKYASSQLVDLENTLDTFVNNVRA